MAVIYLRSADGSDASDGLTWANAKATLAAALTAAGAGGTVYVSDNHAESQASAMTLTSPGTAASPVRVICVDDAGDPEPPTAVATTATVTTTGSNTIIFAAGGFAYVYGITFTSGARIQWANGTAAGWDHESCTFVTTSAGAGTFDVGSSANVTHKVTWRNCTCTFANAANIIGVFSELIWMGGSVGGTVPTTLFGDGASNSGASSRVVVTGVNLSALGSGKNLFKASNNRWASNNLVQNCKLGSSVAVITGSIVAPGGFSVVVVNCDSADTNYRYAKHVYQGEITHETTIVRTGGASDGTTAFSRKMVSSANSKFYSPLVFGDLEDPLCVWNETTGSSVTVTVETVTDNVTLTDAEAWIEVEYLGTSGFPIASFGSDRAADILATPANQTSSSETWTTTGLTTPVKQKLSVSFTPQEKGWIQVRVMLAKASTTMYFCPKVDVT